MNGLWATERLGDHILVQNGYAFSSSDYVNDGHFVMRIANVQNGYVSETDPKYIKLPTDGSLDRFILAEGDILMSLTGNIGRVGLVEVNHLPAVLNQRVARIKVRPCSQLSKSYLLYFLQSDEFREELSSAGHGVAQQNVSTKELVEIKFPVPPVQEQRRIVAILDETFEAIATAKANAEKNLQNAAELWAGYLQSVFTEPKAGWVPRKLGDLISIQNGYAFKSGDYSATGHFVMRIGNVQDGEITLENPRFIELDGTGLQRFALNEDDILVSLTGNIGRVGIIRPEHLPAVLNQRVARITPRGNEIDGEFLFKYLSSRTFRESLSNAGHGAAQQNVSTKEIETVCIYMPPLSEQSRITEIFSEFETQFEVLDTILKRKLIALDELKKSLLHQAFTGQLTAKSTDQQLEAVA